MFMYVRMYKNTYVCMYVRMMGLWAMRSVDDGNLGDGSVGDGDCG